MRLLLLVLWACLPLSLAAENKDFSFHKKTNRGFVDHKAETTAETSTIAAPEGEIPTGQSLVSGDLKQTYLLGVGLNHVYDSYLSPLDYKGSAFSFTRIGERTLERAQGRWSQMTFFDFYASHLTNVSQTATTWDGELQLNYGQHYHCVALPTWDLAVGGLLGAHVGGTYNTRNGNNPAQMRAAVDLSASAVAVRQFSLWKKRWTWRTQCDIPLMGVFFSPHYGQSYYEIFTLGHTDDNVLLSHPFNAPSLRLMTSLSIPFGRNSLTFGYKADLRQSTAHHLDRHSWQHSLLIGFTTTLQIPK